MRVSPNRVPGLAFGLTLCVLLASVPDGREAAAADALTGGRGFPYAAFEDLKSEPPMPGPAAALDVRFGPGKFALPKAEIFSWIDKSARAIASYYGHFPAQPAKLLIVPVDGIGAQQGQSFGYGGAAIRILLGRDTPREYFDRDWVMVHEMVHTTFPDVDERYAWLQEGLATYIEPIARAETGDLSVARVWQDLVENLPQGQPRAGDMGLDNTHTWGRTYWGGALFWLTADIEILKRTNGRRGLKDALRAVNKSGGTYAADWPLKKILETADAGTGTQVLIELYAKMSRAPVTTDLDALWASLGISMKGGIIRFDDAAPLAAIRKAIVEARPAPNAG